MAPALQQFAQLGVGGPMWGLLCALVTVQWLARVFNDAEVEIGITLVSCYFTFFVAEVARCTLIRGEGTVQSARFQRLNL